MVTIRYVEAAQQEPFIANMIKNLEKADGFIMAEAVLLALSARGIGRQEAHEIVRNISMLATEEGKGLKVKLLESKEIMALISLVDELDDLMDPRNYVGKAPEMVDRAVAKGERLLNKQRASKWDPY